MSVREVAAAAPGAVVEEVVWVVEAVVLRDDVDDGLTPIV